MAFVALVHVAPAGHLSGEPPHLVQLLRQCVPVKGIPWTGHRAHHEPALERHRKTCLHAELVRLVGLAFGDALRLRRMHRVDLALRVLLLRQHQLRQDHRTFVLLEAFLAHLPLQIAEHPPGVDLQPLSLPGGPLELLRLPVPAVEEVGCLRRSRVALAELDLLFARDAQQRVERLQVEPRIRGMGHGLGLHRGVDDDRLHLTLRDRSRPLPSLDREREEPFHALLPDAPPPPAEGGWINGEVVLKELLSAEVLPVGVLDPGLHHLLVRDAEGVLEQHDPRHDPDRHAWTSLPLRIERPERRHQPIPIDGLGQPHDLVLHVEQIVQSLAEHPALVRLWLPFWLHGTPAF